MLDFGFYNMDCMQGMKEFPDKYFDLAVVDPPYGDGGGYMEERNEIRRTVQQVHESTSSTMSESGQVNHGGRWGGVAHQELAEHGQRNSEKNRCVGCCAGERLL